MKLKTLYTSIFAAAALTAGASIFADDVDPNTYYWKGGGSGNGYDPSYWKLSDGTQATEAIDETKNLVWEWAGWMNWLGNVTAKSMTLKADGAQFNLNADNWLATVEDFSAAGDFMILQVGNNGGANGMKIGGNLILAPSEGKNLTFMMRTDPVYVVKDAKGALGTGQIDVAKQLQMNALGNSVVRIALSQSVIDNRWDDMSIIKTTVGSDFTSNLNLGGLTGRGVFSASTYFSTNATVNFQADSNGKFAGGEWTGAFTKYDHNTYTDVPEKYKDVAEDWQAAADLLNESAKTAKYTAKIVMNSGDTSAKQTMNVKKASTLLGESTAHKDVDALDVQVDSGYLKLDSEIAINNLYFNGGKLELSTSEKIASAFFNGGGTLVYAGVIIADFVSIDSGGLFTVDFSNAASLAGEICLISSNEMIFGGDVNKVFSAIRNGTTLNGTFAMHDNGIYFTAAVPEPATIAAIFGAVALVFAMYRRKNS